MTRDQLTDLTDLIIRETTRDTFSHAAPVTLQLGYLGEPIRTVAARVLSAPPGVVARIVDWGETQRANGPYVGVSIHEGALHVA